VSETGDVFTSRPDEKDTVETAARTENQFLTPASEAESPKLNTADRTPEQDIPDP
jgi:hypothetical protein